MSQDSLLVSHLVDLVVCGDARDWLPRFPDKSVDLVVLDPPWPGTNVDFGISLKELYELWPVVVSELCRITDRLVVILGCDIGPRFLYPIELPFFRVIWLRRIPPEYRGSLLYSADVAYLYGHRRTSDINRVIGGECDGPINKHIDNPHPAYRNQRHLDWLIKHLSRPGDLVVDPMCGSGTTLVAAAKAGRRYFGCDIEQKWTDYARSCLAKLGKVDSK